MLTWIMNHIGLDKLKHTAYSFVISAIAGIIVVLFEFGKTLFLTNKLIKVLP